MIATAAIKTADGKVWTTPRPGTHPNVYPVIAEGIDLDFDALKYDTPEWRRWKAYTAGWDQGFMTDKGEFLTREEALAHVMSCGQAFAPDRTRNGHPVPDDELIGGPLTSEDLW